MNTFRVTLLSIFGVLALIGFAMFVAFGAGGDDENESLPTIAVWGEVPQQEFDQALKNVNAARREGDKLPINYRAIDGSMEQALVEGFASGNIPHAIIVPHDKLLKLQKFLQPISFESYPQRNFQSNFIEAAEIYMRPNSILALPFAVDPLVMYWNRDILTGAGFAQPPQQWGEIAEVVDRITQRDFSGNIDTSALAFGEYTNVTNAKAILSTLLLQSGNPIVETRNNQRVYSSVLNVRGQGTTDNDIGRSPRSALSFYTEFSNPGSDLYSWNRALPESRDMFIGSNLALYFGYASEAQRLRELNPNLNFDVAPVPQIEVQRQRSVYGDLYAFGILQRAGQKQDALTILNQLTSGDAGVAIAEATGGVSVLRSRVAQGSPQSLESVAYDSAIITDVWYDPDPDTTDSIFEQLISDITSGRQTVSGALSRANERLNNQLSEFSAEE